MHFGPQKIYELAEKLQPFVTPFFIGTNILQHILSASDWSLIMLNNNDNTLIAGVRWVEDIA
jgi:hypothetical protein